MDKLPTCRICLVEDVRMYVVVNKDMHKVYEKLTDNPFVTKDRRPMLACTFCCTKLKQCCRFQRQCREAEELFAVMLNEDHEPNPSVSPDYLEFFNGFITTPVHHLSIVDENQNLSVAVKEELTDFSGGLDYIIEPKMENLSDNNNEVELENVDNSYSDIEYKPELHFEADPEDNDVLVRFQTEVKQDQGVSRKKRRANTKRAPVVKESELQKRRIKQDDVVTEVQKQYEQSESKVIQTKVENSSMVSNINLDTSVCNISDNDENGCKISNNTVDTDDVNEYQKLIVKEKRFTCEICQRSFHQKCHLNRHIRVHTGENRYQCGICERAFTRTDLLYKHMQSHTGKRPFKCDVCKSRFKQKNNLQRHSLIHTGVKPYKCDLCLYKSCQKTDLKKHIRIHTDEKPYKCDICQHRCNQKSVLKLHMIRKHIPGKNLKPKTRM